MASSTNLPYLQPPQPPHIQPQATSGTGVRLHGLHFIRTSWQNISRASKFMLVTSVFFIVAQIAVSIAILVLFQARSCDKPLDTYLTVHTIRLGLLLPLLVYQYLTRPNFLQRHQQQPQQRDTAGPFPTGDSPSSASTSPIQQPPNLIQISSTNSTGNSIKEWCERLKSLLDLFGILWFIVGNYLLFTSTTCPDDSPGLYYTVMAWVLLSYLVILIPIILCVSIIFCLPCVLVVLRLLHIADVPGMTAGAAKEELLTIPVFKYQPSGIQTTTADSALPDTPNAPKTSSSSSASSSSWSRHFLSRFKRDKNDIESESYTTITIPSSDDAVCSICLSEYEKDDLICKLWCGHFFHKECVHEWLGLNSLCPLCKQDFRGKNLSGNDDHSSNGPTHESPHP